MANVINNVIHAGFHPRVLEHLEQCLRDVLANWKQMEEAWQQFHQSAAGRHVTHRVWMRHSAMLEVMNQ